MKKLFPLIMALVLFTGCSDSNNISGNYEGSLVTSKEHDIEMEKLGFKVIHTNVRKAPNLKLSLMQKDQKLSGILIITENRNENIAEVTGTFIDNKITMIGDFKNTSVSIILSGTYEDSSIKGKAKRVNAADQEERMISKDGKRITIPRPDFDFILNKQ